MASKRLRVEDGPSNMAIDSEPYETDVSMYMNPHPIFFLEPDSPPRAPEVYGVQRPNKGFLDRCRLCNKMILPSMDIFMYKDWGYCREECRAVPIAKDDEEEKERKLMEERKMMEEKKKGLKKKKKITN